MIKRQMPLCDSGCVAYKVLAKAFIENNDKRDIDLEIVSNILKETYVKSVENYVNSPELITEHNNQQIIEIADLLDSKEALEILEVANIYTKQ